MALRKQVVSIPMDTGIDAGKDPKIGGGFTRIQNGIFTQRHTLAKRNGQDRSTATVDGSSLHPFGSSLVSARSGKKLQIYDPSADTVTDITSHNVYFLQADHSAELSGSAGGAAYVESIREGNVLALKDDSTLTTKIGGAVVDTQAIDGNGRLLVINGKIRCYWGNSTAIKYVEVAADGTIGSVATVTDGGSAPPATSFLNDACVVQNSAGDPFVVLVYGAADCFIALLENGNNNATIVEIVSSAGASLSGSPILSVAPLTDTTFVVTWCTTTEVYAAVYNVAGTRTIAPPATTLASPIDNHFLAIAVIGLNITGGGDAGTIYLTEYETNGNHAIHEIDGADSSSTYSANATNVYYNQAMFAKPCEIGSTGEWLVPTSVTSDTRYRGTDLQSMIVLCSAGTSTRMQMCGVALSGVLLPSSSTTARVPGLTASEDVLPAMHPWSGGIATIAAVRVNREPGRRRFSGWTYTLVSSGSYTILNLDISHHVPTSIESDGLVLFSGMLPTLYDGEEYCEQGFVCYPEDINAADAGGSGSNWSYVATFEKAYASGHVDRSVPTPEAVTVSDTSSVDVSVRTCNPTLKTGVKLVTWRTVSDGTVWYRCYQEDNDTAAWYEDFTDSLLSDASIARNEQLYTTGGVLENDPPAPYGVAALHNNRVFTNAAEKPRSIALYTKTRAELIAPEYSAFLRVGVPEEIGGDIKALASLLDKLVILKQRAVLASEGSGLTDIGGGVNYTDPYLISPSVGCVNPRSVVRYPKGIMFEAADGLWTLTQAMQLEPTGDRVRYYTGAYSVSQAISLDDQHLVMIATSDGPALIYDWLRDAWSIYENHSSAAAAVLDGQMYRLDSSGYVWTEDGASYDDNGTFVSLLVETGWINLGTIGHYGRLYGVLLFGQNLAAATLRVKLGYNHAPAWNTSDVQTLDLTTLQTIQISDHYGSGLTWATYADQAMILRVYPDIDQQKCQSVRIQISDEEKSGSGQTAGYSLSGIALEVGLRGQLYHVQSARRIGGP